MKLLRAGIRLSKAQRGLTLVELMIALLIGLFLMGGLATLLMNTKNTFVTQSQLAMLQDNQRMAMTMISDVVQHGGYYPNPLVNSAAIVPTPFNGTESATAPGDTIAIMFRTDQNDDVLNCSGTSNTTAGEKNYTNTFSVVSGQLRCTLVVGASTTTYDLVSGVQDLQILYGVRRNAAATCLNCVDTYLTATQMTASDRANVISVAITLTFDNPLYKGATDGQPQLMFISARGASNGQGRNQFMNEAQLLQRRHRGFVLVSSILLLLVMSILAVSMFRSFGMQEKISGNVRDKQRAFNAAQAAEQYAEAWLRDNQTTSAPVACTAGLLNANNLQGQICSNKLSDITGSPSTTVPWKAGSVQVGVSYKPGTGTGYSGQLNLASTDGSAYFDAPRFFIEYKGNSPSQGDIYQIDALGYGGSASAVAVVRSTFSVSTESWAL